MNWLLFNINSRLRPNNDIEDLPLSERTLICLGPRQNGASSQIQPLFDPSLDFYITNSRVTLDNLKSYLQTDKVKYEILKDNTCTDLNRFRGQPSARYVWIDVGLEFYINNFNEINKIISMLNASSRGTSKFIIV